MIYADANLLIYAATETSEAGSKYRQYITKNFRDLCTSFLTIDEVAWTLAKETSFEYAITASENYLKSGMKFIIVDAATTTLALDIMRDYRLKPRDAFHAATMRVHGITKIASEDKDFDKVPWIKRVWI